MKIGEFFVELLVDSASGKVAVGDLLSKFKELEVATVAEIGALIGLGVKLAQVADQAMETAVAFSHFETQTGLSSQKLQRWQIVAEQVNVTAETMASSVSALQRNLAAIRLGQGNIAPFQILGIGANQDAFAVLEQLRERLRSVNPATASNLMSQMGLDPAMLKVLRLSNEEFARLSGNARGLTEGQYQGFLRLRQTLTQLWLAVRDIALVIVSAFGPQAAIFERMVYYVVELNRGLTYLRDHTLVLGWALKALAVANPFSAMFLLLDDVVTYFRGGNSLIGLAIDGFKRMFSALAEEAKRVLPDLERVTGMALKLAGTAAMLGPMAAPAIGAQLANAVTRSVVQNNSVEIGINSNAPADEVARQSAEALRRMLNDASLQLDGGR